jgi:HK97 family phage portal protein
MSQGSLTSSAALPGFYPGSPASLLLGGFSQDYLQIWRTQYAVRATVTFLARNIAQLGLPLFKRVGDDQRERLYDHPLAKLLREPNPWTTRYRFLDSLVHDMAIFDRSYWLKNRAADDKSGPGGMRLLRLPPMDVTPRGSTPFYPEWFEFHDYYGFDDSNGGYSDYGKGPGRYNNYGDRHYRGSQDIPASEIVFFRGYCGWLADVGGVSPLESLREILEESYWASVGRSQSMRNGARISGYIQRPADTVWSDEARQTFKKDWQNQYTAYGPQAGGTPILEDGMTFVPASMTPKDLQYVEARKLTREEVAAAYFVPPPMLGLLEHATFSNITEQHLMLYQDTLGPWLSMLQDEIKLQLIPDFDRTDTLYCEFNLADKLRGNFEARQDALVRSVGGPYRTINEGRALENLPPVDGGDALIQPLNVTQPGDTTPIPAQEPPPPATAARNGRELITKGSL